MFDTGPKKSRSSKSAVIFMIASVLFAGLAGLLLSVLLGQSYPTEPLRPVVVAAHDVPAGERLSRADLKLASLPVSSVPRGSFRTPGDVLRREAVLLVPLVTGESVLAANLSQPQAGLGVAAKLERGQRAVAVRVDASVTLSRLLYPGAHIDLFSTVRRRDGRAKPGVETTLLLQDVVVLAVGPDIDPVSAAHRARPARRAKRLSDVNRRKSDRGAARVITLALSPEQLPRFILARREGSIDLALRSPRDATRSRASGVTLAALVTRDDEDGGDNRPRHVVETPARTDSAPLVAAREAQHRARRRRRARARRARARRARARRRVAARRRREARSRGPVIQRGP